MRKHLLHPSQLTGTRTIIVRHRTEPWQGTIAKYAHTKDRTMVLWDRGGGQVGAGLHNPEDLVPFPTQQELFERDGTWSTAG